MFGLKVLAVIKAKNFDHAMEIANNTEFGLTGAVYSKNPEKIRRAEEEFHVGNLYLNRKCTGAMVGAHPFGGFNMSGTDSKTGGKDYLLLFLQAKAVGGESQLRGREKPNTEATEGRAQRTQRRVERADENPPSFYFCF